MLGQLGTAAVVGALALAALLAMALWSFYGRLRGDQPKWSRGVPMSVAGEVSILLFTATLATAALSPNWRVALVPLMLISVTLGLYAQFTDKRKYRKKLAALRNLNAARYPEAFGEACRSPHPDEIPAGTPIRLFDNLTGRLLGEVPGEQLRPLVRYLEKYRSVEDWGVLRNDAYLVEEELEMLRAEGAAPELLAVLQQGMASSHDLELRWAMTPASGSSPPL